jgi:DNA-binding NtrC family response regulator
MRANLRPGWEEVIMRDVELTSCRGDVGAVDEQAPIAAPVARLAQRIVDRLVGDSIAMRQVRDNLPRIARADGSVLIEGASGTGKELAARIVHDLSRRASGPFVAIDCGALADGVLESELFGHARGAFTSASGERSGLFEEANGGTIFLDEISNTSLSLQSRLLRVLQEREVRRVGANRARQIDVRVIAASNRNLAADAEAGRFRQDLLYRLDVLALRMPSLCERRDDIVRLVRHQLSEVERRTGDAFEITPRALSALLAHDWPGNVRELGNVIERAMAFAVRGVIDLDQLPTGLRSVGVAADKPALEELLAGCERAFVLDRLESNAWNRTRTATELGITRRCLFNKILKHGLSPAAEAGA